MQNPEQLYAAVFDTIKDPLLLVNADGDVVLANDAASAFFEFGPARRIRTTRPLDRHINFDGNDIVRLMESHASVRDYKLTDRDGNECGITLNVETLSEPSGETHKLLHLRNEGTAAHREFWKDEMIAMVSHEIKNPLSAMKNSVEILLSQTTGELTEGQKRFLNTSGRSIDRLTHLVDGYLDVSRIHSGAFSVNRQDVSVSTFLADAMNSFSELFNTRGANIELNVESSTGSAYLDTGKLEQVLINLLSNALKFTAEKGQIVVDIRTVGVEEMHEDMRLLPWSELGRPRILEIIVRDSGLGMSTDTLDHVFERYGQPGDDTRTGQHLGLNISRALVEAQGGWMNIKSELGIGTTVTAYVPQDRNTVTLLERISQLQTLLARYAASGRKVAVYVLGKYEDFDWEDIASTWKVHPTIRDTTPSSGDVFHLWPISAEVAVAVLVDHRDDIGFEQIFTSQFVLCDEQSYVLGSYAIGACNSTGTERTLAQLLNVATARMLKARDAMAHSTIEKLDWDVQCVTSDWKPVIGNQ